MKRLLSICKNLKQILNDSNVELVNKSLNSADSLYSVATELNKIEIDKLPQVLSKEIIEVCEEDLGEGKIKDYAFYECRNLKEITIPNGVTEIGEYAFRGCKSLESITIPDGVTTIGDYAFSYCDNLTSITIPDSVTSIGKYAFYDTGYYNDASNWENNVLYINNHLIEYTGTARSVIVKENILTCADYAFSESNRLSTIELPDSLRNIGKNTFYKCRQLESINIPDSVETIGASAFEECTRMDGFTITNNMTKIENRAFYKTGSSSNIEASITIHNNIKVIGDEAFYQANIGNLILKNGVEYIGKSAFCEAGINSSQLNIPPSVKYIGTNAFTSNVNINGIYFYSEEPPVIESKNFANGNIYVPRDSLDLYKSATNWSNIPLYQIIAHDKIYEEE